MQHTNNRAYIFIKTELQYQSNENRRWMKVGEYVENVKSHYVQQIFSASDIKATMENCLLEW